MPLADSSTLFIAGLLMVFVMTMLWVDLETDKVSMSDQFGRLEHVMTTVKGTYEVTKFPKLVPGID